MGFAKASPNPSKAADDGVGDGSGNSGDEGNAGEKMGVGNVCGGVKQIEPSTENEDGAGGEGGGENRQTADACAGVGSHGDVL